MPCYVTYRWGMAAGAAKYLVTHDSLPPTGHAVAQGGNRRRRRADAAAASAFSGTIPPPLPRRAGFGCSAMRSCVAAQRIPVAFARPITAACQRIVAKSSWKHSFSLQWRMLRCTNNLPFRHPLLELKRPPPGGHFFACKPGCDTCATVGRRSATPPCQAPRYRYSPLSGEDDTEVSLEVVRWKTVSQSLC